MRQEHQRFITSHKGKCGDLLFPGELELAGASQQQKNIGMTDFVPTHLLFSYSIINNILHKMRGNN